MRQPHEWQWKKPQWSLDMEKWQFRALSVTEAMDGLIVKISNSNGLEFCPDAQLAALCGLIDAEIDRRQAL